MIIDDELTLFAFLLYKYSIQGFNYVYIIIDDELM